LNLPTGRRKKPVSAHGIVCLGFVSAAPDKQGRRMTIANPEQQMREIRKKSLEMSGIAFYGFQDDTPETVE
jgi:hypothetical protein